jgi:hypothetical protein
MNVIVEAPDLFIGIRSVSNPDWNCQGIRIHIELSTYPDPRRSKWPQNKKKRMKKWVMLWRARGLFKVS